MVWLGSERNHLNFNSLNAWGVKDRWISNMTRCRTSLSQSWEKKRRSLSGKAEVKSPVLLRWLTKVGAVDCCVNEIDKYLTIIHRWSICTANKSKTGFTQSNFAPADWSTEDPTRLERQAVRAAFWAQRTDRGEIGPRDSVCKSNSYIPYILCWQSWLRNEQFMVFSESLELEIMIGGRATEGSS